MRKHTVMKKCLSVCLALLLCGLPVSIYASNETAQTAALPEQKISDICQNRKFPILYMQNLHAWKLREKYDKREDPGLDLV